jgi:hypothetical protein
MNLDEFRESMNTWWRDVQAESVLFKDPYIALDRLRMLYKKFDNDERVMADTVIAEWVLSEDEGLRFNAQSLVADFKIRRAKASLRELAMRLRSSREPGAPFELTKVERSLEELDGDS